MNRRFLLNLTPPHARMIIRSCNIELDDKIHEKAKEDLLTEDQLNTIIDKRSSILDDLAQYIVDMKFRCCIPIGLKNNPFQIYKIISGLCDIYGLDKFVSSNEDNNKDENEYIKEVFRNRDKVALIELKSQNYVDYIPYIIPKTIIYGRQLDQFEFPLSSPDSRSIINSSDYLYPYKEAALRKFDKPTLLQSGIYPHFIISGAL